MWYELFLRREAPLPLADLRQALPPDAQAEETETGLRLTIPSGTLLVSWHPSDPAESGQGAKGLDLLVPGGANPELAEAACDLAFRLAESCALSVYDPQLGRTVVERDAPTIQARMARFASYLTETVGLDEAADARHIGVDPPRLRLSLRTRFYLVLALGLVVLALLARYC